MKPAEFHTVQYVGADLLRYLRANCTTLKPDDSEIRFGVKEAFLANDQHVTTINDKYHNVFASMRIGGFLDIAPIDPYGENVIIYLLENRDKNFPTSSKTHFRLPQLQYLLTLTPEDFFLFLQLLSTTNTIPSGTSFFLNTSNEITAALTPFFMTNDKTWRLNPEFADRRWTSKDDVEFLAALDPTTSNQLYALQYLASRTDSTIFQFPIDTSIELELEWQQISPFYVAPDNEQRRF